MQMPILPIPHGAARIGRLAGAPTTSAGGAQALVPVAFLLFVFLLTGCGTETKCFSDGHCIEIPSNAGYYTRWLLGVVLTGITVAGALFTLASLGKNLGTGCGLFVVTALFAQAAMWAFPEGMKPRERALAEAQHYEWELGKRAAETEAQKRQMATPTYQLQQTRAADAALKKRREEMQKTQAKWKAEYDGIRRELQSALQRTGARSHEELLKSPNVPKQTLNLLNRAAHLRVLVSELDALLVSADQTLVDLDQQIWKLEKMVELNAVTTPEEAAAIQRALVSATELVRERQSAVTRADIAAEEAKLFRELVQGAK